MVVVWPEVSAVGLAGGASQRERAVRGTKRVGMVGLQGSSLHSKAGAVFALAVLLRMFYEFIVKEGWPHGAAICVQCL